ncbi:hypothetical protein PPERSA_03250 [Pseudocohnilembus persalinus]|uniref:Tetratricopeptide repeat protein n=1 Tax=Pseudocohnilembus persalinus TaxID=266149 RepID=A0A0V0QYJ7_PSEPJ|nr:hypothetical protein PPERSA_03250 [Pseudocohnilembus persalinus]|eukprot:KRX07417.1 hypothetical protein PPERSA_03250 [Pseudocohnilembus persalinus]
MNENLSIRFPTQEQINNSQSKKPVVINQIISPPLEQQIQTKNKQNSSQFKINIQNQDESKSFSQNQNQYIYDNDSQYHQFSQNDNLNNSTNIKDQQQSNQKDTSRVKQSFDLDLQNLNQNLEKWELFQKNIQQQLSSMEKKLEKSDNNIEDISNASFNNQSPPQAKQKYFNNNNSKNQQFLQVPLYNYGEQKASSQEENLQSMSQSQLDQYFQKIKNQSSNQEQSEQFSRQKYYQQQLSPEKISVIQKNQTEILQSKNLEKILNQKKQNEKKNLTDSNMNNNNIKQTHENVKINSQNDDLHKYDQNENQNINEQQQIQNQFYQDELFQKQNSSDFQNDRIQQKEKNFGIIQNDPPSFSNINQFQNGIQQNKNNDNQIKQLLKTPIIENKLQLELSSIKLDYNQNTNQIHNQQALKIPKFNYDTAQKNKSILSQQKNQVQSKSKDGQGNKIWTQGQISTENNLFVPTLSSQSYISQLKQSLNSKITFASNLLQQKKYSESIPLLEEIENIIKQQQQNKDQSQNDFLYQCYKDQISSLHYLKSDCFIKLEMYKEALNHAETGLELIISDQTQQCWLKKVGFLSFIVQVAIQQKDQEKSIRCLQLLQEIVEIRLDLMSQEEKIELHIFIIQGFLKIKKQSKFD